MVTIKSIVLSLGFSSLAVAQYGYGSSGSSSSAAAPAMSSAATTASAGANGVIDVKVGASGLTFSPSSVQANVGDMINFHFYPSNHSVAESSFSSPCQQTESGIWSGFIPSSSGAASMMFSVMVNDTKPHWIYCSQHSHCQNGMVMVINPAANSPNTLDAYMSAAKKTTSSTSGTTVEGGNVAANVAPSSSASSSSSSASPTTSGNAAVDSTPRNWVAMGAGLAFSGIWAALMA